MGMFDWVDFKLTCPFCGNLVDGFQSKDAECFLRTVPIVVIANFYDKCESCGMWLEFKREDEDWRFIVENHDCGILRQDVPLSDYPDVGEALTYWYIHGRRKESEQ